VKKNLFFSSLDLMKNQEKVSLLKMLFINLCFLGIITFTVFWRMSQDDCTLVIIARVQAKIIASKVLFGKKKNQKKSKRRIKNK
jgi:hypothetical protein